MTKTEITIKDIVGKRIATIWVDGVVSSTSVSAFCIVDIKEDNGTEETHDHNPE